MLVILSKSSISSEWLKSEVETALARESLERRSLLFPIRLDDSALHSKDATIRGLVNARHIGDFTRWSDDHK